MKRTETERQTHTPGPWEVERDGCSLTMQHQVVATAIAPDWASLEEQRANARLIASAPEMLALLRCYVAGAMLRLDGGYYNCGVTTAVMSETRKLLRVVGEEG